MRNQEAFSSDLLDLLRTLPFLMVRLRSHVLCNTGLLQAGHFKGVTEGHTDSSQEVSLLASNATSAE